MRFGIGDRLDGNESREIALRIEAANLSEEDRLGFKLNGAALVGAKETPFFNDCSIEYPVAAPPLRRGENEIEILLERRNPLIGPTLRISSMHVSINYRQ